MKKKNTPKTDTNASPAILLCEPAAKAYADARRALGERLQACEAALAAVRAQHLPDIKLLAKRAGVERSALEALITANPSLFTEPRTVNVHGIKFGYQKGKGRVEWADKDKLVRRILAICTDDQQDLLLETTYTPRKDALATLDAVTLKKLGVTITGTGDTVVIKAAEGEVEKLVARILEEGV